MTRGEVAASDALLRVRRHPERTFLKVGPALLTLGHAAPAKSLPILDGCQVPRVPVVKSKQCIVWTVRINSLI